MLLFALKNVVILVSPFNRLLGQTQQFPSPSLGRKTGIQKIGLYSLTLFILKAKDGMFCLRSGGHNYALEDY